MSAPAGFTLTERDRFVDDLLGYMMLEEKVGQLVLLPVSGDPNDGHLLDRLRKGRVSAIVGITDRHDSEALQQVTVEQSRLGIPLLFAADTMQGIETIMPVPLAAAASWDPEAIKRSEQVTAAEASAAGLSWALAPAVRLTNTADPRDRATSCGSEPFLAVRTAIARIRGLQGDSLRDPESLLACLELPAGIANVRDAEALLEIFLAVVREADVASAVHGIEELTQAPTRQLGALDLMRGQWGFSGILLAEWSAIAAEATGADTRAGYVDLPVDALIAAVGSGRITEERIDAAVRRVLAAKFNLGLFREPYRLGGKIGRKSESIAHHREAALDLARKSIVLLRNDPALLPLAGHADELLIVGTAAGDRELPLAGRAGTATSVIDGLEQLGLRHKYAPGLALRDGEQRAALIPADRMAIGMAAEAARRADTVVLVLGEGDPLSSAGELGEAQRELFDTLATVAERLIVVTLGSRPLSFGPAAAAILHAGGLGTMSGIAVAEVLMGRVSPQGRLACAFSGYDGHGNYPFGYGLGYGEMVATEFSLELGADRIVAALDLSNAGELEGMETLQLYVRRCDMAGAEGARLKGFSKIQLAPGEVRCVTFELGAAELGSHDRDGRFAVAHGRYEVLIGTSATTVRGGEIVLPPAVAEAMAGRGLVSGEQRRRA